MGYRLRVWAETTGGVAWDSGSVRSISSATIRYGGQPLSPGTAYRWTVTTTSLGPAAESVPSESAPSEEGAFVTALFDGFAPNASWQLALEAGALFYLDK